MVDHARADALIKRAVEVIPGGVQSGLRRTDDPLVAIESASGAYFRTVDGHEMLDMWQGGGANVFGHAPEELIEAIYEQMTRGFLYVTGITANEVELAETIVSHLPRKEKVLFAPTGGEVLAHLVRAARAFTGRKKIIKFEGCYHGASDGLLVSVAPPAEQLGKAYAHSEGALTAATSATIPCTYNDLASVERALAKNPQHVAAILVEPILHSATTIEPEPGFLEGLRKIADDHGIVLIYDELVSCRHHLGGYQQFSGVLPDLTAAGKSLSGGMTLSYGRGIPSIMDLFNTAPKGKVAWAGTYNAHPLAVASALAAFKLLENGEAHAKLDALGHQMRDGLNEIIKAQGIEDRATVTGFGSIYCLWFARGPLRNYRDVLNGDRALFAQYRRELFKGGLYERPGLDGFGRNHISTAHTSQDIDHALSVSDTALRAALAAEGR